MSGKRCPGIPEARRRTGIRDLIRSLALRLSWPWWSDLLRWCYGPFTSIDIPCSMIFSTTVTEQSVERDHFLWRMRFLPLAPAFGRVDPAKGRGLMEGCPQFLTTPSLFEATYCSGQPGQYRRNYSAMAVIDPAIKHGLLVGALIAGIVSAGCQPSVPLDNTVCEYQPGKPATQINIEDQGVFSLLRRDKLTSEGLATEIERTDVDGGSKLGFAMDHQKLIAIAGPTTLPLETGVVQLAGADGNRRHAKAARTTREGNTACDRSIYSPGRRTHRVSSRLILCMAGEHHAYTVAAFRPRASLRNVP